MVATILPAAALAFWLSAKMSLRYVLSMPKPPPNLPARKDRVHQRGRRDRLGTLEKMDDETLWTTVSWDDGKGPRMCHLYELEKAQA